MIRFTPTANDLSEQNFNNLLNPYYVISETTYSKPYMQLPRIYADTTC